MSEELMIRKMPESLAQKMMSVFKDINAIAKDEENEKQNYKYVKEASVTAEVRDILARHGVFTTTSVKESECHMNVGRNGIPVVRTFIDTTFWDGETGDGIECRSVGYGMDSGDKGGNKAATAAVKYQLLKGFLIPTGDDIEKDDVPKEDDPYSNPDPKLSVLYPSFTVASENLKEVPPDGWSDKMKELMVDSGRYLTTQDAKDKIIEFFKTANVRPASRGQFAAAYAWSVADISLHPRTVLFELGVR
jgi:hypothetical protein